MPRDGRLDVTPGPVGGPDPAGIADRPGRPTSQGGARHRRRLTDRPQPAQPVLRVDQVDQHVAFQAGRGVSVIADGGAGEADRASVVAHQDDVADPVGQLAELLPRLMPQPGPDAVPVHQDPDPPCQREQRGPRDQGQDRLGGRAARQDPADQHQRGHRRAERGQCGRDVRHGPGWLPRIPGARPPRAAHPGGAAQHAEPGDQEQLGCHAGMPVDDLCPDRERVADGHREQGDDRRHAAAPRRHREREHAAEYKQVSDRVDELSGERARVITRVRVPGAEHRDPADDEEGGRHDVPVRGARHRGAEPGPVTLGQRMTRRLAP